MCLFKRNIKETSTTKLKSSVPSNHLPLVTIKPKEFLLGIFPSPGAPGKVVSLEHPNNELLGVQDMEDMGHS